MRTSIIPWATSNGPRAKPTQASRTSKCGATSTRMASPTLASCSRSLGELGITALDLDAAAIGTQTPQGNQILAKAAYARADGTTGFAYELAFAADRSLTQYTGDRGHADALKADTGTGIRSATRLPPRPARRDTLRTARFSPSALRGKSQAPSLAT